MLSDTCRLQRIPMAWETAVVFLRWGEGERRLWRRRYQSTGTELAGCQRHGGTELGRGSVQLVLCKQCVVGVEPTECPVGGTFLSVLIHSVSTQHFTWSRPPSKAASGRLISLFTANVDERVCLVTLAPKRAKAHKWHLWPVIPWRS